MKHRYSILLVFFVALLAPLDAFAYLDPGTGSALLQGILGALAAIGVILKLYWHRFLRLLGIRKGASSVTKKDTTPTAETNTEKK